MADSEGHGGKASKKNQRRAEKRRQARIDKLKEDGVVTEIMEMQDPVGLLREKLQEAKDNKDHKLAAQIRHQIWIAQDTAAGCSIPDAESLGVKYDLSEDTESTANINKKKVEPSKELKPTDAGNSDLTQTEKRLRNLKKKLNQINALKLRKEKGEALEETQIQKVNSETDVIAEIGVLEDLLSGKLKL